MVFVIVPKRYIASTVIIGLADITSAVFGVLVVDIVKCVHIPLKFHILRVLTFTRHVSGFEKMVQFVREVS